MAAQPFVRFSAEDIEKASTELLTFSKHIKQLAGEMSRDNLVVSMPKNTVEKSVVNTEALVNAVTSAMGRARIEKKREAGSVV